MRSEKVARIKKRKRTFDIFCDSPSPPAEPVRHGLLPPLPVRGEELVWGYHILRKAEKLGCSELYILPLALSKGEALSLALTLEGRCDRYSWEEKAAILSCMRREDEPVAPDPAILSLVQSEGSFIPLTERYAAFPGHLRSLVDCGVIDMKTAETVESLPPGVVARLDELGQNASFSQRRQLFIWMYEIIERDRLSPEQAEQKIDELPGKGWFEEVRRLRFPAITSLEKSVDEFRNRYVRGTGIDLKPPPQFEGDAYTVRFEWKTAKQMERIIENLKIINEHRDELFQLLF
jgi:hypothetical protein